MTRPALPDVTLIAAASVNVSATLAALRRCLGMCEFGGALFFTDGVVADAPPELKVIQIERLATARAYSRFVLADLPRHFDTSHALIVQWDGFILRPDAWDRRFLTYDYIGAPWPQFDDDATVGNGGFSLRSRRLMEACRAISAVDSHPEDLAICRIHRPLLEREFGLRFADPATASHFSYERTPRNGREFGFHGVFNMPVELGDEEWWKTYKILDERGTLETDFWPLLWAVIKGPHGKARACRMLCDRYS